MNYDAIVQDYLRLRATGVKLNTELVKTLKSGEIGEAATALGMLHGKHIDLNTHDEINVLMDYAIHDVRRDGVNAVDRMLRDDPPAEGSDQMRLLRSLQGSRYAVFRVDQPIPGVGVRGHDAVSGTPILLIDMGFSNTATPGAAMATRIQSPADGWWMSTGAALPLHAAALDQIADEFEDHVSRHGVEPTGSARTATIIRACIESGASEQIVYATPNRGGPAGLPPVGESPKVGRNDPCPCGSRKKYKKCCGA